MKGGELVYNKKTKQVGIIEWVNPKNKKPDFIQVLIFSRGENVWWSVDDCEWLNEI